MNVSEIPDLIKVRHERYVALQNKIHQKKTDSPSVEQLKEANLKKGSKIAIRRNNVTIKKIK